MLSSINSHKSRLDILFTKVNTITDLKMQSEWSKYVCILTSGYIEESLRSLLIAHATINSSPTIKKYVENHIKFITNCKNAKIKTILQAFDDRWVITYENELTRRSTNPDELKNAIDSVIGNRHRFAHGGHGGLSFSTINNYYTNVKTVVDILTSIIPHK